MITSKVFNTPPGAYFFSSSSLRRVRILGVEREGIGAKIIAGISTPSGNEVAYLGVGRLTFDSSIPFNSGEKVYVLYET